ncbi:MAG TPA: hypothetical protein VGE72_10260 [Azospirillum sp.]
MRTLLIPAIVLAMSVSTAALAQSQQSGGQQPGQKGQSTSSQATSSQAAASQSMSTRSYKEVENSLKQAGIQEVKTLNAAYLVSAVTKDGEQVTFVVDPPGAATSASGGGQGGQASQTALRGQQQVREDLTKAGFTNVQIMDAAYLATGKTKNGDEITMMIDPTATTASSGMSGGQSGSAGQSGSSSSPQQGGKTQ